MSYLDERGGNDEKNETMSEPDSPGRFSEVSGFEEVELSDSDNESIPDSISSFGSVVTSRGGVDNVLEDYSPVSSNESAADVMAIDVDSSEKGCVVQNGVVKQGSLLMDGFDVLERDGDSSHSTTNSLCVMDDLGGSCDNTETRTPEVLDVKDVSTTEQFSNNVSDRTTFQVISNGVVQFASEE